MAPFITEQAEALREAGCVVRLFAVEGHGLHGYLRSLPTLKRSIAEFRPDIVHAHYGLCGLLCTLQHRVPVVVTYHGSDINDRSVRWFSVLAIHRAAKNVFVSRQLMQIAGSPRNAAVIPCGVDTRIFHPIDCEEGRSNDGVDTEQHLVLFAGAFDNPVKDPQLAREVCSLLPGTTLLELKGYSREQVAALMKATDALLLTSRSEGSPQVVKEALACGCPVVSVDVGDVKERISGLPGCYVSRTREPKEIADLLRKAICNTAERKNLLDSSLDNRHIASRLIGIYTDILHEHNLQHR